MFSLENEANHAFLLNFIENMKKKKTQKMIFWVPGSFFFIPERRLSFHTRFFRKRSAARRSTTEARQKHDSSKTQHDAARQQHDSSTTFKKGRGINILQNLTKTKLGPEPKNRVRQACKNEGSHTISYDNVAFAAKSC